MQRQMLKYGLCTTRGVAGGRFCASADAHTKVMLR